MVLLIVLAVLVHFGLCIFMFIVFCFHSVFIFKGFSSCFVSLLNTVLIVYHVLCIGFPFGHQNDLSRLLLSCVRVRAQLTFQGGFHFGWFKCRNR